MRRIIALLAPFLLIGVLSCGPKVSNEMTQMHDEVMVIHDEVMPKMKDIIQLKNKLRKWEKEENSPVTLSAITELEKADESMMDWMAEYKKPKENNTEAISYLTIEKEKISKVRDDMLTAIKNAKSILDE